MKNTPMTGKSGGIAENGQITLTMVNMMKDIFHFKTTVQKFGIGI